MIDLFPTEITWQGEYDKNKASIAIIASFEDNCFLIDWAGYDLEYEISEACLSHPYDLGLKPPEHGIWKWCGVYKWFEGPWEYKSDGEYLPKGNFERLTQEEAYDICLGKSIINKDYYKQCSAE